MSNGDNEPIEKARCQSAVQWLVVLLHWGTRVVVEAEEWGCFDRGDWGVVRMGGDGWRLEPSL